MIIGECPYDDCNSDLWIPISKKCPVFQKHECKKCKRVIWTYHSRIDPYSYTEEGFLEEYKIDEETKSVEKIIAKY